MYMHTICIYLLCVYMHICIYINNKYLLFMYSGGSSGLVAKSCLTLVTPSTVCRMYGHMDCMSGSSSMGFSR